jgi:hypothetical protein
MRNIVQKLYVKKPQLNNNQLSYYNQLFFEIV